MPSRYRATDPMNDKRDVRIAYGVDGKSVEITVGEDGEFRQCNITPRAAREMGAELMDMADALQVSNHEN